MFVNSNITRVAVIGAGPAGITAAYCLAKAGINVDVFEAGNAVGGMAKTIELWGCKADLGPHRFFSNARNVNELWLEVVGNDFEMVERLTRIYYKNRFFHYPLRPANALANLGILEATTCLLSYFKEVIIPTKDLSSFEGWVKSRFGKRLYEIFFKTYSEKLWGIPCNELDSDFAAQRIKKFSLPEAVKNALFGGKRKHKTLVDEFAYPLYGSGMVYERMAEKILQNGGKIFFNTPVKRLVRKNADIVALETEKGELMEYSHFISSMPLTILLQRLDNLPDEIRFACEKLRYRNTILVYLKVKGTELFRDNWLYIHSSELLTGRITNFRNWLPTLYPKDSDFTILAMEYWCYDDDDLWQMPKEKLIELAKQEIDKTGLASKNDVLDGEVVKLHRSYPVYSKGYKELLNPIRSYLSEFKNLMVIGRYGAFKYNNQDHSIYMGIQAAENIIHNSGHDLWEINTDYDIYQEKTEISKTGLKKL